MNLNEFPRPVLGIAAHSGTGKTTLLEKVIPLLRERGLRLAVVKHAHHGFDVDKPGKDSHRLRSAGANQMLIASSRRWALMNENDVEAEPKLEDMLSQLDLDNLDLVLVEGFKKYPVPKLALRREAYEGDLIDLDRSDLVAVATDSETLQLPEGLARLDINSPEAVADWIISYAGKA